MGGDYYTLIQSEYRAYIWTSLGEFRYERYEYTSPYWLYKCFISQYYEFILSTKYKVILE